MYDLEDDPKKIFSTSSLELLFCSLCLPNRTDLGKLGFPHRTPEVGYSQPSCTIAAGGEEIRGRERERQGRKHRRWTTSEDMRNGTKVEQR